MDTPTRARVLACLAATSALLASCGGGAGVGSSATTTEPPAETLDHSATGPLNDADIRFLHAMIPHHADAISMAELVAGRTERAELLALAEAIITSQRAEVAEMQQLLEEAAEPVGVGGEGHEMPEATPGAAVAALQGLSGVAFDVAFIDAMSAHRAAAIADAEGVLGVGEHDDVRRIAEMVIATQQADIERLAAWKVAWLPDPA